ncbi:MAG: PCMD domain-containing protein [Candidatus Paraprevotella stercoravium]|uniref:PCMD domain-containing protein n=1 Tax=Candidatus Paraprevotella stercoravium TaxID=2838725 RepID=A0A9E2L7Q5_9BACT|nr:PCMD domain-containing protein [Candidatus Paraprevotella stercoravium]
MKKKLFLLMPFCALLATSCIKDEPLNSECDIEVCKVHHEASDTIFYALSDTLQKVSSVDTVINFYTRSRINPQDLSQVRVTFDLTPGATITPASGSVQDFSQGGVVYTVVSEDKLWSRTYKVRFLPRAVLNPDFDFENVELEQPRERFYIWFAYDQNQKRQDLWATGNSGFALSRSSAKPHEYPSVMLEQGVSGKGVKLETCSTGAFGAMVNMRIAAGNLFLGSFDTQNALKDAMKATRFGVPVNRKPVRFTGYYKFQPGEVFKDRYGIEVPGRVDAPDAYAVLYKNTDESGQPVTLYGDDVLTNENIVAIARVPEFKVTGISDTSNWEYFDLPLEYKQELDMVRLSNLGYNLAVVFTSSIEGATFCGAVGSTLLIDESAIIYE